MTGTATIEIAASQLPKWPASSVGTAGTESRVSVLRRPPPFGKHLRPQMMQVGGLRWKLPCKRWGCGGRTDGHPLQEEVPKPATVKT